MKTKIFILATMPLLTTLAGCQSPKENRDPQNPIESQTPQSAVHGDVGIGVESRNTNYIAPVRQNY